MPADPMFWLAIAAFAWGLSLATYRWFAVYNGWPMGEWQAHRPGLPIAIGLFSILFAMLFAIARGGPAIVVVPLLGFVFAVAWIMMMRVAAQVALLLAPASVVALLIMWMAAASHVPVADASFYRPDGTLVADPATAPAATDREADIADRDRGITRTEPGGVVAPLPR
ncbi:MAG: hypothetical protein R3D44_14270 [Hyphomicrobiaceae bacterium]